MNPEDIERDMPECEPHNMKDEVHEGLSEMRETGEELKTLTEEMENERQANYETDAKMGL